MDLSEQVPVFKGMIDKEKITIPIRSPKIFTLSTLYDANEELLGDRIDTRGTKDYNHKLNTAVDFWTALAQVIPDWRKVKDNLIGRHQSYVRRRSTHTRSSCVPSGAWGTH